MRVFEQTGRTDGNRGFHYIKEGKEVVDQTVGQLCTQKMSQYHIIRLVAQGYLVKVVRVHKLVEDIRTQHHGFRNSHRRIFIFLELTVTFYQIINKGQTTPFSSQRTFADTGKVGIGIKAVAQEFGYHTAVLHFPVFNDGIKNNLPVSVYIL